MKRFDDLDDLEREIGPSLRDALRRAAAAVASEPRVDWLSRGGRDTPGALFDDPARDLDELGPDHPLVMVTDLEPTPDGRVGHRRWPVIAAAVAAVVLMVGGALVWAVSDHDSETRVPAGPDPTSTTDGPLQTLDDVLPPEGVTPSTPETGELVAAIAFSGRATEPPRWSGRSLYLYGDGRLIWFTDDTPGGIAERRLGPDGIERVRSAFLEVSPQLTSSDIVYSCWCLIWVNDGGRLLSNSNDQSSRVFEVGAPPAPPPEELDLVRVGQVDRLVELVTHLESSLPASAWEEREARPFAPSKYRVCVWKEITSRERQAIPDLSNALAEVLPTTLVERLDGQGWVHEPSQDCNELQLADARLLAESLTNAGIFHNANAESITYPGRPPGMVTTQLSISLTPFLPDGTPRVAPG